jgi:hypothetical protein
MHPLDIHFFSGIWVWTQDLTIFALLVFTFQVGCHVFACSLPQTTILLSVVSWVAGITDAYLNVHLINWDRVPVTFLKLSLNCDPSDLHLPSNWDYRCESLWAMVPGPIYTFLIAKHTKKCQDISQFQTSSGWQANATMPNIFLVSGISQTFCLGWREPTILLYSASLIVWEDRYMPLSQLFLWDEILYIFPRLFSNCSPPDLSFLSSSDYRYKSPVHSFGFFSLVHSFSCVNRSFWFLSHITGEFLSLTYSCSITGHQGPGSHLISYSTAELDIPWLPLKFICG